MRESFVQLLESNLQHTDKFNEKFDHVQEKQEPEFVTVCCSDSRVLQDHMWGNEHPGKIFTCSNIGNRTFQRTENGKTVSGDVLYPVEHTGTETIIVVGHTGCGAVTATYKDLKEGLDEPEGITHCINLLEDRLEKGLEKLPEDISQDEAINYLVEYNVDREVEFLLESEEVPEDVNVIGAVYDFQDVYTEERGRVHVINVNGKNSVEKLRSQNPEIEERISRLWTP